jgi:hypothetical protein
MLAFSIGVIIVLVEMHVRLTTLIRNLRPSCMRMVAAAPGKRVRQQYQRQE